MRRDSAIRKSEFRRKKAGESRPFFSALRFVVNNRTAKPKQMRIV
jgi:hypothetical protein